MEDVQGDLGRVSESLLSNNSPSGRNQVERSYEEGEDGGEIMVEVIGSDVLLDGVSGNKECDLGLGEVRDLVKNNHVWEKREEPDGTQNFLEAMDVSTKRDECKGETTELKLSVPQDEKNYNIAKELNVDFSEPACAEVVLDCGLSSRMASVSSDEVRNQSATTQSDVVVETTPAVVTEDVRNTGDLIKDGAVGAVDKKEEVSEKQELLPLVDNVTDLDHLGADLGMSQEAATDGGEAIMPSHVSLDPSREQTKDVQVDGINIVVGDVGSVSADVGNGLLATSGPKDGNCETKTDDACDQGVLEKFESNHGTDDVSCTNLKCLEGKSVVFDRLESGGVTNINDGPSDVNLQDFSSVGNEKCLKNDENLETDTNCQNHALTNEPNQLTDGFDTAEVKKDKGLTVVHGVKTVENLPNTASLSCPGDDKIVHGDLGIYENQTVNVAPVVEAIDDQKAATTQVGSKMSKQSLECYGGAEIPTLDPYTENVEFSCTNVEMGDATENDSRTTVNSQGGTPIDEAQKSESINSTPKEISKIGAVSDITQANMLLAEITEKAESPLADMIEDSAGDLVASSEKVNIAMLVDDNCCKPDGLSFVESQTSDAQIMDFEEDRDSDRTYHGGMEEFGTERSIPENEDLIFFSEDELVKSASSLQMNISSYLLPTEDEDQFSVLDLVWGKVGSHPWWPGQVFDPADASENAVKYYKQDAYLIAYFGDQTFSWNDASELKPFRSHFSEIEKQNNSEAFQSAVSCALGEVSRRLEFGLSCSCIPKDACSEIESQVVENAGIREESSQQYGVDRSSQAAYFEPDKLLDYIKDMACHTASGADRLDLAIARAQLSAFCRMRGYRLPTGFPSTGELLENDVDTEQISDTTVASLERKHILQIDSKSRKEKSLTELMAETESFPDAEDHPSYSGRKRKALDPLDDGLDKRVSTPTKYPTTNQPPKPSFKIGECIRRVASQLKGNNDETAADSSPRMYEHSERRSVVSSAELFSSDEILKQLQLLALDPKRGLNILSNIHNFFMGFRSSIALNRRGRKKKADSAVGGSGEEFEFDDVNDSYWTDRIVHNYPEEQLLNNSENREGNIQLASFGEEKTVKPGRKSRKRFSSMSYPMGDSEIEESAKRKKQESSPAELILNFAERNCLPSEINLNKMFRRFGPLMESETEVDHDSGRAKVIFKRGSDAEVACNSSEKFNIFGPVLVNYQIGYSPLISVKISPLAIPQCQEDVTLLI